MDEEVEPVDELESIPAMLWPDVPRLGFGAGYERHLDADVEWGQRFGMFGYVEGYRRAAAAVFEAAANQNPDYSVWPLAFLWRHHLELAMKDIIAAGRQIEGQDGRFPKGHDLLKLWREARPHIERCGPPDSPELRNVEANIVEFQKIDPGGDGFLPRLLADRDRRDLRGAAGTPDAESAFDRGAGSVEGLAFHERGQLVGEVLNEGFEFPTWWRHSTRYSGLGCFNRANPAHDR